MDPNPKQWNIGAYAAALGLCALTTALALPWHAAIALANIILLYVLAVAVCAALWGRGPAVLASFVGVLCFNFFFVPPRFSLSVADGQYLLTFGVMLVVSLLVGYLGNAYRAKAQEAERRSAESDALHLLASSLSGALTLAQVAERSRSFMHERFGAGLAIFVPGADERLHTVDGAATNIAEQTAVQGIYARGSATGEIAGLHEESGTLLLPLDGATRRRGVLAVYVAPAGEAPPKGLLAAVAALVATALERIYFVEVARSNALESESVKLRNSILSAISHDIRTPLTVLFGLADQIVLGDNSPQTAASLRDQAHRLHRMVDNLLDMARLRSGHFTLRRDWQSLPEIVAACVQGLGPVLAEHQLRLVWPDEMPLLRLDALLMERVFCNLLENAAKYSPEGSRIDISATLAGDCVEVCVDNAGRGFPPERIAHVFSLFERGEQESVIPGMGIGLSICRTIVEAHGGRIEALNRIDGARMQITLPRETAPSVPVESEAGHG